jgi:hypothetical protein
MRYLYYKSDRGNFGDDLNPWLWSKFFGENNVDDNNVLLGIGSILHNDIELIKSLKSNQRKIVFGAGVRPSYTHFKTDKTWDIRFLRGPLSAGTFGNKYKYIADAAYAMRLTENFNELKNQDKKHEIGLMPYFKSMQYFDWEGICKLLGFKFISPYSENGVEQTVKEIASCKVLITEAMHGAIVADILRVPWSRYVLSTPFTEGPMVSEFKWADWLHSINLGNIDVTFINFYKKTRLNSYILKATRNFVNAEFLVKSIVKKDLVETLKSINNFYLSDDKMVNNIDLKISEEISLLKNEIIEGRLLDFV